MEVAVAARSLASTAATSVRMARSCTMDQPVLGPTANAGLAPAAARGRRCAQPRRAGMRTSTAADVRSSGKAQRPRSLLLVIEQARPWCTARAAMPGQASRYQRLAPGDTSKAAGTARTLFNGRPAMRTKADVQRRPACGLLARRRSISSHAWLG